MPPKTRFVIHVPGRTDIGCDTAEQVLDALNDLKSTEGVTVADFANWNERVRPGKGSRNLRMGNANKGPMRILLVNVTLGSFAIGATTPRIRCSATTGAADSPQETGVTSTRETGEPAGVEAHLQSSYRPRQRFRWTTTSRPGPLPRPYGAPPRCCKYRPAGDGRCVGWRHGPTRSRKRVDRTMHVGLDADSGALPAGSCHACFATCRRAATRATYPRKQRSGRVRRMADTGRTGVSPRHPGARACR